MMAEATDDAPIEAEAKKREQGSESEFERNWRAVESRRTKARSGDAEQSAEENVVEFPKRRRAGRDDFDFDVS